MKEVLYEVRCLKSNEDMILALAGQLRKTKLEFHQDKIPAKNLSAK